MSKVVGARCIRRWLLVAACAGFTACSWLEAEFSSLDRASPAQRDAAGASSGAVERP